MQLDGSALSPGISVMAGEPTTAVRGWPGIPAGHDALIAIPLRGLPSDVIVQQSFRAAMYAAFDIGGTMASSTAGGGVPEYSGGLSPLMLAALLVFPEGRTRHPEYTYRSPEYTLFQRSGGRLPAPVWHTALADLYQMPGDGVNCPLYRRLTHGAVPLFVTRADDAAGDVGARVSAARTEALRALIVPIANSAARETPEGIEALANA